MREGRSLVKVAFHFVIPAPRRPELDGAVQEALWLRDRFGGQIHYHYPGRRFRRGVPMNLCGVGRSRRLAELDREVDLHHLFVARPLWLPILWRWRRPLVLTLLAPPATPPPASSSRWPPGSHRIVVPDEAAWQRLVEGGITTARQVAPAVDPSRRGPRVPPPKGPPFRILAGSAPWTRRQLHSKGFEQLLEAVAREPQLVLTVLWRGAPIGPFRRLVERRGLTGRVELVEDLADVPALLGRCHGAVVLEAKPGLVKGYPQSLLEALAAGRPIVASSSLAIAEMCRRRECGVVVRGTDPESVHAGLATLVNEYDRLQRAAQGVEPATFSHERFVDEYGTIYRELRETA